MRNAQQQAVDRLTMTHCIALSKGSGKAGQWREALTPAHVSAIVAAHGPMMMRFGYLAEDCGARKDQRT